MDTNLIPVTETEMRDFFGRVVSSVVALSETAKQVGDMREQLALMQAEISNVKAENERLIQSERDAWELTRSAETRERTITIERDEAVKKAQWQQETLVARDQRVGELEVQVQNLTRDNDTLTMDNENIRHNYNSLEQDNVFLKQDLATSNASERSLREELANANASLASIRSILVPPPVSQDIGQVSNW